METEVFLRQVEAVDKKVAHALNEAHKKVENRLNKKRTAKAPFADGSWVWLLNPKKVGGNKIDRFFQCPNRSQMLAGPAF